MKDEYKVDANILGDLFIGELEFIDCGICNVEEAHGLSVRVRGEGGHSLGVVGDGLTLEETAEEANKLMEEEYNRL